MTKTHQEFAGKGYLEDQREFFDKLVTQDWEAYQDPYWDRTRALEVRELLQRVPSLRRILDVGCGCGYHDQLMARSPGVEAVVGIDYSACSIEQAERHYPHPNVRRLVGDLADHSLSEELGLFDVVTSFQVLEHLSNPLEFLRGCARLVAPGGRVVIVMPNRLRAQNVYYRMRGKREELIDDLHFREYSLSEAFALGREAGLTPTGWFGHSLDLNLGRGGRLRAKTNCGQWLGRLLPRWGVTIGVIYAVDR
jgi:SAM-dependent methyltransferase